MRFVLNTHADDAAAAIAIHGLGSRLREAGHETRVNAWDGYRDADVAVFLGYDEDLEGARRANPAIRTVLVDPKQSRQEWIDAARSADQLVVSSIEQRDAFYRLNRNLFVWSMFPPVAPREKVHTDAGTIGVGYHGNRVHLECFAHALKPALEELGRRRPVELLAIYNFPVLGRATEGLPDERFVRVREVAWTPDYAEELAAADIGVVPNELPLPGRLASLERTAARDGRYMYEPFDHLVRLKASSNHGRLYPFAQLGIPVVVDFAPSASQFVRDGESGLVASSPYAWLEALEALADSPSLRMRLAAGLRQRVNEEYGRQVDAFVEFCRAPLKPPPVRIPGWPTAEEELARLDRYASPSGPAWRRALRRVLRR